MTEWGNIEKGRGSHWGKEEVSVGQQRSDRERAWAKRVWERGKGNLGGEQRMKK